jgi:hypothetical protein
MNRTVSFFYLQGRSPGKNIQLKIYLFIADLEHAYAPV